MTERQALLNIAARLDMKEVEAAQTAARKVIRQRATAARDELRRQNEQIGIEERLAIQQSDADIARQFHTRRAQQANSGVLAMAIAANDKLGRQ